ncbi:hypothetical protein [Salinactinospora qingdaonensis]
MWDYACQVRQAFNGWLVETVTEVVNLNLMAAAIGLLTQPVPTPGVEQAWRVCAGVVNTGFVLLVTVGGVVVMTNPTVQTSTGIKKVAPRLVLGFVGANASWWVCELLADLGNATSLRLVSDTATGADVATAIGRVLADPAGEVVIVVVLYLVAGLLELFFFFALLVRLTLWLLLTAAAPLALACHALPQTEGVARLWWRAMVALMLVQLGQALTLRVAVTIFLNRGARDLLDLSGTAASLLDVGIVICLLYVLARIPFWAFKRVFNYQASPALKAAKFALNVLVLRNLGKAAASATAARAPRGGQGGAPPGAGGGPAGPRGGRGPTGPRGSPTSTGAGSGPRRAGSPASAAAGHRTGTGVGRQAGTPPARATGRTSRTSGQTSGAFGGHGGAGPPGPARSPRGRGGSGTAGSAEGGTAHHDRSRSGTAAPPPPGSKGARRHQRDGATASDNSSGSGASQWWGRGFAQHRPRAASAPPPPDPRRYRAMRPHLRYPQSRRQQTRSARTSPDQTPPARASSGPAPPPRRSATASPPPQGARSGASPPPSSSSASPASGEAGPTGRIPKRPIRPKPRHAQRGARQRRR